MTLTVLTDGPYRIDWNDSLTFNVFLHDVEVNCFTVGDVPPDFQAAQWEAREWWYLQDGKASTQEVVRESVW